MRRKFVLCQRVDAAAKMSFIGFVNDFAKAMEKLENFYGNPVLLVLSVSQTYISDGGYSSLIPYSSLLGNNFTRLVNLKLQHEMSKMSTMSTIVGKFRRVVKERIFVNEIHRNKVATLRRVHQLGGHKKGSVPAKAE